MRPTMRGALAPLALLSILGAGSARGQVAVLQPGMYVRVPGMEQALVTARTSDSLYLLVKGVFAPVVLPIRQLSVIQIRGEKSHAAGARRGAVIGGAIGLALGVGAWVAGDSADCKIWLDTGEPAGCDRKLNAGDAVLAGVASAALGAGIGALIGRREWHTLRLNQPVSARVFMLPGRRAAFAVRVG